MGAKKFGMSLETQGKHIFLGRISRGFWWDIPGVPKKLEKKHLCSFLPPINYFGCTPKGSGEGSEEGFSEGFLEGDPLWFLHN